MASIVNSIFNTPEGDAALILGDIEFGHMEVPDYLNFGGDQLFSLHQLVGGKRVINALGRSDTDITWNGFFFGDTAFERARALDFLRTAGEKIELAFGELLYLVIIKSYSAQLERFYQIPYSITCTVIENLTIPVPFAVPDSYNDAVNVDMKNVSNFSEIVSNAALSSAVAALQASINAGGDLSSASPDQVNNIINKINNTQSINNGLINANGLN